MSGIEDDPGPCVCADCQNAREEPDLSDAITAERNALRATLAKIAAIVADPDAALVVDRVRAALEPQPKGTKP